MSPARGPSHGERILALIRETPGLTDGELRAHSGIATQQMVNQACRRLTARGLIQRVGGPRGQIVNLPAGVPLPPTRRASETPAGSAEPRAGSRARSAEPTPSASYLK